MSCTSHELQSKRVVLGRRRDGEALLRVTDHQTFPAHRETVKLNSPQKTTAASHLLLRQETGTT